MLMAIITFLAFFSALVTSVFGFGAGLVLTPLLSFFIPLKDAIGIGALIFLFTSGSKLLWYVRDINWKIHRSSFALSIFGLSGGFALISVVDASSLEKIYALLLGYFGLVALVRSKPKSSSATNYLYPVFGGFFAALIHGGGVFFIRRCQTLGLDRVGTVGTVAAIHFSMNIFKVAFFTGSGMVPPHFLFDLFPAYLAAIMGTWIGRNLLKNYLNENVFQRGMGVLLLIMAARYIV